MSFVHLCIAGLFTASSLGASDEGTQRPLFARPGGAADMIEMAAGYQAIFTCSAHFHARRPLADILEVELIDLKHLGLEVPKIDEERKIVRALDAKGRSMLAAYRRNMGCTLLPPHWGVSEATKLPNVEFPVPPSDLASLPFPLGDKTRLYPTSEQQALVDRAFDGVTFGQGTVTIGVVIVKGDEIVGEKYREGFGVYSGYRTWSTSKSISATLIAIAIQQGILKLDESAYIPEWQFFDDPRQKITVENLLHMSSGLWSQGSNTNAIYFGGQDVVSAATTTPLEAVPGTRWKYANNDTLLLLRALRARLHDDHAYLSFPYKELLYPIGMYHTRMETDYQGNIIGSSQTYTTARDLARFGLLYLREGMWNGKRIISKDWVKYVTQPAPSRPFVEGQRGYGAQFWLLDGEGGPAGSYTTAGNKGQYVSIIPSEDLVIVRMGVDPQGKRWEVVPFVKSVIRAFGSGH